jgi:chloramphenicol-sensitive protein RarD
VFLRGKNPLPRFRGQNIGVFYALGAFGFWGIVPIYFKALQHVAPLEILAHRVVWSVPFTALLITMSRDWKGLWEALSGRKVLSTLFLTAMLVASNWFVFIYAIVTDHVLQASLGYYINPLVNVLLGMVFLKERLPPWQGLAVLLAAAGTFNLALSHGKLPWISLALAFSFSLYGLLRKTVRIESLNGLFVETSLLFPLAFGYLTFLTVKGASAFWIIDWQTTALLALAGLVTSLPLVWFTSAARRLRYTTLGILQYLGPSLQFLLAVFIYREPFTHAHLLTFGCIWSGLAIFVVDSLSQQRKNLMASSS